MTLVSGNRVAIVVPTTVPLEDPTANPKVLQRDCVIRTSTGLTAVYTAVGPGRTTIVVHAKPATVKAGGCACGTFGPVLLGVTVKAGPSKSIAASCAKLAVGSSQFRVKVPTDLRKMTLVSGNRVAIVVPTTVPLEDPTANPKVLQRDCVIRTSTGLTAVYTAVGPGRTTIVVHAKPATVKAGGCACGTFGPVLLGVTVRGG